MFFDPKSFDFIDAFLQNLDRIRAEYRALDAPVLNLYRNGTHQEYFEQIINNNGWVPSWQVGSSEKNYQWLTYGLIYQGIFPNDTVQKMPCTTELLKQFPFIQVAAFSRMKPLSMIAPHCHPELGGDMLTCHIGIELAPKRRYLCVNGEFQEEVEDKALVFDGSQEHFALNSGDRDRTILYMEFDRSKM